VSVGCALRNSQARKVRSLAATVKRTKFGSSLRYSRPHSSHVNLVLMRLRKKSPPTALCGAQSTALTPSGFRMRLVS
jgi:hypothetical protein